jgi:hypothetical protein
MKMSEEQIGIITTQSMRMGSMGLRVLGLACRPLSSLEKATQIIDSKNDSESEMDDIYAMNHGDETCPSCGCSDCECNEMNEAYGDTDATDNEPDYPTNQEESDDALQYSGGLNDSKSTGQTTVPVVASQEDRLHTMEESVDSFLNLYQTFKTK